MFTQFLVSIVDGSRRFAKILIMAALLASIGMGWYVAGNIKINTDINQLLSDNLGWRKRESLIEAAFPQKVDNLVIVIDGKDAEKTEAAAAALAAKLSALPDKFNFVSRPDALPFFHANGLLYLSKEELAGTLDKIAQLQPMLGTMVSDPSLRGFLGTIGMMMQGAQSGAVNIDQLQGPLAALTDALNAATDGKSAPIDFSKMMASPAPADTARELRKFILAKPTLDYSALEPGEEATDIVRKIANDLSITPENGLLIRLTGPVPLNDEEFASVADGTGFATIFSAALVLVLLFLAMRSWRIVIPIALTLTVGLVASTAFATVAVGSLNLISVAFAVMFIGIAVDFGIQFGVRYRDQRFHAADHADALRRTAYVIALPLAMAAGSTALGFLAFTPTDYRGVSELGLIAGAGMIIAFILNVTLLPAIMSLTNPPAEAERVGYACLEPLNQFLLTRKNIILPLVIIIAICGLFAAMQIRFDFDPLDLKDPKTESVSTMFDLMQDKDSDAYAAQILAPSLQEAQKKAAELEKLPEVDHVMTLESFIPEDQDKKLAMIGDTGALLAPSLSLPQQPAATDKDNLEALQNTDGMLHMAGDALPAAKALADAIDRLLAACGTNTEKTHSILQLATENIIAPMQSKFAEIQTTIQPHPVTLDDLPPELKRDWITPDGKALVEIFPKRGADNNPRDLTMLNHFIDALQKAEPDVSGTPVSIRESGRTITSAFIRAGIYGVVSIAFLSFLVMRNIRDVLLMLTPLAIAGILTLATMTVIKMPLNFANVIALPLLLSLGVSYAVYFVFYARMGHRDFLQSSMARAVLFSAATVLTAFSSLCFSSHPGTRNMGELLTISLIYSLLSTFLLLPVLLAYFKPDTTTSRTD